ncbi:hypothetical protein KL916_000942, partial [Ogataea parapolymorpha]
LYIAINPEDVFIAGILLLSIPVLAIKRFRMVMAIMPPIINGRRPNRSIMNQELMTPEIDRACAPHDSLPYTRQGVL